VLTKKLYDHEHKIRKILWKKVQEKKFKNLFLIKKSNENIIIPRKEK
jgi:hypothetical protein